MKKGNDIKPKSKAKKPTVTPGTILDKIKIDNTIRAKFSIASLYMDAKLRWEMEILVEKTLPKTYRDYRMTMVFDEEPFEIQIEDIQKKIHEMETENALIKNIQDINFNKERISSIMEDRDKKKKECRTIEFVAEVQELKYKESDTKLTIRIPDLLIPEINDRKNWFTYYRLELKPMENFEITIPGR